MGKIYRQQIFAVIFFLFVFVSFVVFVIEMLIKYCMLLFEFKRSKDKTVTCHYQRAKHITQYRENMRI